MICQNLLFGNREIADWEIKNLGTADHNRVWMLIARRRSRGSTQGLSLICWFLSGKRWQNYPLRTRELTKTFLIFYGSTFGFSRFIANYRNEFRADSLEKWSSFLPVWYCKCCTGCLTTWLFRGVFDYQATVVSFYFVLFLYDYFINYSYVFWKRVVIEI
jgi:hypothetical protein